MPDILKLEEFQLTDLLVRWHEEGNEGREESERLIADGECGLSYEVFRQKENPCLFALEMRFQFTPGEGRPKAGYEIDATIEGFFTFPEGMPEDNMQTLIRLNGLTILYGILRGEVASVTGLFQGGRFVLPAVYMPDIIESIESQKPKPPKKRPARASKKRSRKKS